MYTSDELQQLWKNGHHSIGEANEKTAFYIASYSLKSEEHIVLDSNGKFVNVRDSFQSSRNPAIGLNYFRKNYKQLVDSSSILPRYYQKKLEEIDSDYFEQYENNKQVHVKNRGSNQRLAKYVIGNQKLNDSEFRKAPDQMVQQAYKQYLKSEVELLKENL